MTRNRVLAGLWCAIVAGGALSGCRQPTDSRSAGEKEVRKPVVVERIDRQVLDDLPGKRRGKVVLVDFWATWCTECVKLFPHTMDLHRRFADQGLDVVTISLDDPDDPSPVQRFLEKHEATSENFVSAYGTQESVTQFKIPGGGIPYYRLYDRSGTLRRSFGGGGVTIDSAELDRVIQEVLDEK